MLHWDDELERRMAPLRAKVEAENRKIAELQSKLVHAEMEALRLGWYLGRMEEENSRLQERLQAAALGQAWGGEGLDEVKGKKVVVETELYAEGTLTVRGEAVLVQITEGFARP